MTNSISEELHNATLLLNKGDYKKASEIVEIISEREKLSKDDRFACSLLDCKIKIKFGELEKSLKLVEKLDKTVRKQENILQILDLLIVKTEIFWRSGEFNKGIQVIEEGKDLLRKIELSNKEKQYDEIKQRKGELLVHGGVNYWYKGELEQALKYYNQSLEIFERLDNKKGKADVCNDLGLLYCSKGDLNKAIEYYKESLMFMEELGYKKSIASSLNNLGIAYQMKGDHNQALECHKRSYNLGNEIGNQNGVGLSLLNIGANYRFKGEIQQALEYYEKSQLIFEKINDKKNIALVFNNLADVYQLKGDLNLALEYQELSLTLYEELGIKQDIALSLVNLGEIYRNKNNLDWALKSYKRSLSIYVELENYPSIANVLYEMARLALDSKDHSLVEQYFKKLKDINKRTDVKSVNHRYKIIKALSLKKSNRTRDKVKAEEIFEKLIHEENVDNSLRILAVINLCDLMLSELKMTGEEELIEKIKNQTNEILDVAKQQKSHSLLAEAFVLQSKLSLLELDIKSAQNFLDQALSIAEENGLRNLSIKIYSEKSSLEEQVERWQYFIKRKSPLNERLELTRLDELLSRVANRRFDVTEEEIKLYSTRAKSMKKEWKDLPKRKYELEYLNLIKDSSKVEKTKFRAAIAQIGLSSEGNILNEFYEEMSEGFFILKKDKVEIVRSKVKEMIENAYTNKVNIILFPELSIDLNYKHLFEDIVNLAKTYNMYIIPGSYHDQETKQNISVVINPDGVLWRQEKHIPAIISHKNGRFIKEGIEVNAFPRKTIVCSTELGTFAITTCRDFLDMDLRVELKNSLIPIDLIFNPAFTPVTADFQAAHFDARRSIYAYCFFANIAEIGNSLICTPEKERIERTIPPKEEKLIYKDIDLFRLRSERKKWDIEFSKQKQFIQSTRL
ncbi:MAG: tetratricopeptide repeat protein [Candidatus Hodarchaeales archaeon]